MKLTCKVNNCGTVIQVGPEDSDLAHKMLAEHVAKEHGSIETKFAEVLARARDMAEGLVRGIKPSRKDARKLYDDISSLTGKPLALPAEPEERRGEER